MNDKLNMFLFDSWFSSSPQELMTNSSTNANNNSSSSFLPKENLVQPPTTESNDFSLSDAINPGLLINTTYLSYLYSKGKVSGKHIIKTITGNITTNLSRPFLGPLNATISTGFLMNAYPAAKFYIKGEPFKAKSSFKQAMFAAISSGINYKIMSGVNWAIASVIGPYSWAAITITGVIILNHRCTSSKATTIVTPTQPQAVAATPNAPEARTKEANELPANLTQSQEESNKNGQKHNKYERKLYEVLTDYEKTSREAENIQWTISEKGAIAETITPKRKLSAKSHLAVLPQNNSVLSTPLMRRPKTK